MRKSRPKFNSLPTFSLMKRRLFSATVLCILSSLVTLWRTRCHTDVRHWLEWGDHVGFACLVSRREVTEASLLGSVTLTSAMCFPMGLGLPVRGFASTVWHWSSNQGDPDFPQEPSALARRSLIYTLRFHCSRQRLVWFTTHWAELAAGPQRASAPLMSLSGPSSSLTQLWLWSITEWQGLFRWVDSKLCLGPEGVTPGGR